MSVINSQPLIGASGNQSTAYNLTRSLRFRSSASAYLNRSMSAGTSTQKGTQSFWIKRGTLAVNQNAGLCAEATTYPVNGAFNAVLFSSGDILQILCWNGSSYDIDLETTQVFRDPSAWYHIVIAWDTTQATASNRVKLYVNGSQVTSFGVATYPSQNTNLTGWGASNNYTIGTDKNNSNVFVRFFDGYYAEFIYVDGQALTPSDFGETDTATGVWKPKKYTGTYGTNGFYLKFDNLTSTSTLGNDSSGNSNTWTVNNISLTSGATYDSMKDVPTLTDADTANYCTLNPLQNGCTLSNANLTAVGNSGSTVGTMAVSSGKWYYEATVTTLGTAAYIGFADLTWQGTGSSWTYSQTWVYLSSGNKGGNGSSVSYGATYTTGDVIGIALDLDNGTLTFYKNNSTQGTAFNTGLSGVTLVPFIATASPSNTTYDVNFGQRPFAYTPPSGFKALNTFNLPTPTIGATASTQANDYFDVSLWTGTGSSQSITNSGGFQPDFVWGKIRSGADYHVLTDAVRGNTKFLKSNTSDAEITETQNITSFNSNGFTIGTSTDLNRSTYTFVGWQWKANGSGSSNTAGTITSTVSANTTAGFSIVTYTGNSSSAATVGHGLGVKPDFIVIKSRDESIAWMAWHSALSTELGYLNLTDAFAGVRYSWALSSTQPTSTLITLGDQTSSGYATNRNNYKFVAYCFAEVAGYSKFGSYTGNGSTDGTFVYTGFRPKFVMIKRSSSGTGTANWIVMDTSRDSYNLSGQSLEPNLSDAEYTPASSGYPLDILSNGFKLRGTYVSQNENGSTYIYACFAENPFKYSLAR